MKAQVNNNGELRLAADAIVALTPEQFNDRLASGRIVRSKSPALPDGKIVCRLTTDWRFKRGEAVTVLDATEARVHFK